MKLKTGIIAIVSIAVLLMLFFLPCGKFLTIADTEGQIYLYKQVKAGDVVSLCYIHSVEKVPVIETFIVENNGDMLLVNTTYGSMGAGLPSDQSYNITYSSDGNFTIENINRSFKEVNFMTTRLNDYYLRISGVNYPVSAQLTEGKHLIIRIEDNRPISIILNTIRPIFSL